MAGLVLAGLAFRGVGPIDLAVAPGECVAILGPSGSGKTLLLRAVADLDPQQGEVRLDGVEREALAGPAWRRRVGLLRPESAWWRDTVGEHFPDAEVPGLERLGFRREVLQRAVAHLSSGERQRLALLRLLARRPRALLLDEPTAHLDAEATRAVEALLGEYRERERAPVVWVTHDRAQAERVAARRLRLADGRLSELAPA